MRYRLLAALLAFSFVVVACGDNGEGDLGDSSGDEFANLEPYRAIEKLDDQGRPYLSPWDVDPAVAEVQQLAVDAGLDVDVTGVYDDPTLAIMMAFQYSQGLVPDGVIGPKTWEALDDPQDLPEDVDFLTLVEIANVALDSPSDARQMLVDQGLPLPEGAEPLDEDEGESGEGDQSPAPSDGNDDVSAVVYLETQQVELIDASGTVLHRFPVSSGRDGLTPVGTFRVQSKSEIAYSATDYPEISMKWMTRFNGGIGFHGIPVKNGQQLDTPLGQRPVSAGCIRMDDEAARLLQTVLPVDATVVVKA